MNKQIYDLVVSQFGDDDYWQEYAANLIATNGADSGWPGFTYYSATVPFGEVLKPKLKADLEELADEFGEDGKFSMMSKWKCLDGLSVDEIAEGWDDNKSKYHAAVMNALAWYALEESARYFVDSTE